MDHAESRAKLVIEATLRGSEMRFRADQSRRVHDFDLYLADGTVEAVEVTASVDRVVEETIAATIDPRKGGIWIPAEQCRNDWHIHPLADARIDRIRCDADQYLADIEAAGLDRFFGPTASLQSPSVRRAYDDLRIFSGAVIPGRSRRAISMAPPSDGGAVGGILAHQAVVEEASKDDNRRKLAASGYARRHLAVYIHARNFLPWVALLDCDPPLITVDLPIEVTDAWAFTENRTPSGFSVWRARRGQLWERLGPLIIPTP